MSQTTAAAPQITGKMFLFERPELLNRQQHGELGVDPAPSPFGFCAHVRAVPLTVSEIPEASKCYPVVFNSKEDPVPIAIVGFGGDLNLFVDEKGEWEPLCYVPGYLRRYPFALAGETGGERMALVIDAAYPGVSHKAQRKLFESGEMSAFAKQAMEFTLTYEQDRRLTEQIMKSLKKFDLIESQTAQYTSVGSTDAKPFAQYFGVDEKKLQALSDEQFLELRRMNVLPVLYAQIYSVTNWRNMIARRMRRLNISEAEAVSAPRLA
jgi:hypothetical protein